EGRAHGFVQALDDDSHRSVGVRGVWLRGPTVRVDLRRRRGLLGEQVVIRGVRYTYGYSRPSLGTTRFGRHAASGVHALHGGDLAEGAFPAVRLRDQQQPGNRAGLWCIRARLHGTDDPAAIVGFPARTGKVLADLVSARVEKLGLGGDERPLVTGLILC